jgi:hypothetical protein
VAQNSNGETNFTFRVDAADGETSETYTLQILYAGDNDTGLKSVSYAGVEAGVDEIDENKYIANVVSTQAKSGDIVIEGVNKYQNIVLYNEDGTDSIATSTDGKLSYFYSLTKDTVTLPFTVESHGEHGDATKTTIQKYTLTITKKSAELAEVRANDNLLLYNQIQYTYNALPNAKKVKISVKASSENAKVQIDGFEWAMYSDEQDYDISAAGTSDIIVPLRVSTYPYEEYTTRPLVIKRGASNLKQISVYVQDDDNEASRNVSANDYGEFIALIPAENDKEYVTIQLNGSSENYTLGLYRQGTEIAAGTLVSETSMIYRIESAEVNNLTEDRNQLTISVSDGNGNEALYPLWLNKISSNTAVKTIIVQRGTSDEYEAEDNTDTSASCDSHNVQINDSVQKVKVYIEAEDPTSTVRVGTKSRVGSIEVEVDANSDVSFDIIATATDDTGANIVQTHTIVLTRESDAAELESVVVNGVNIEASGTSYNALNLTGTTADVVLKAKNYGTIEVLDKNKLTLESDDLSSTSIWTDSDMALDNGETTKYVVRVTSQSGIKTVDYMLVLERDDYVGGLEFLKTKLGGETEYTALTEEEYGVYTQIISETDTKLDIDVKTLDSDAVLTLILPTENDGNYTKTRTNEFNSETDFDGKEIYLNPQIKTIYIPITVTLPWVDSDSGEVDEYRYTLKLVRKNLNIGDIKVYAGDLTTELTKAYDDENGNAVYEKTISGTETIDVKVTASGKGAMVSGDYASVGAPVPISTQHNTLFEKTAWELTGEKTVYEFKIRAEDAEEDNYTTVYLNVYKASNNTALESVEIGYEHNGVQGTVKAVKTSDNTYEAWLSSSDATMPVDLKATSESAGATVQIDGNEKGTRNVDTQKNVTTPITSKKITVTASDGTTTAEYELKVHLYDLELISVKSDTVEYHPAKLTEQIDGRAVDIYEIYTELDYAELELTANASNARVTAGTVPTGAADPDITDSNTFYRAAYELNADGYTEIQVKVGMENVPNEFNNIAYLRIYKKSSDNSLDYIDVTYEDSEGNTLVVRAEATGDGTYAVIVPEDSSEVDIKAVAAAVASKVKIEPHTSSKPSYDEYTDYKLTADKTDINIDVSPSSQTDDKTYVLTIYRASPDR